MSGRDIILKAISINKPSLIPMPGIDINPTPALTDDLLAVFVKTLESIGGKPIIVNGYTQINESIQQSKSTGEWIVNTVAEAGLPDQDINIAQTASGLEKVHIAYITGTLGVAENAAIWVKESQAVNRLLPFICQHLVLVINITSIVPTMHEAYQQVNIAEEGYGVFIAGPSKTADIEQSLVIGAHGPRSLTVYLVK